jgi:deoxycytidine triphosphate deaminase
MVKGANIVLTRAFEALKGRLPASDGEAEARAGQWKSSDPLPTIPPSLLNSADICAYVAATGMIHPFRPEDLKPASYAFRLKGLCRDEKGDFVEIEEGDEFELKPNSITFITLEPYIRLPDYVALRFNLKIKNVYRGLLLGTGPLVDPGFEGRLSIPLHNLTANSYRFRGGETMIWVEFTKLSPNERWMHHSSDQAPRDAQLYVPFPPDKYGRQLKKYLDEADPLRVIVSSIPGVFTEAREAAEKANVAATRTQIGTALTIVLILGIVFAAFSLTRGFVSDARNDLRTHVEVTDSLLHHVAALQRKVDSLTGVRPHRVGRE